MSQPLVETLSALLTPVVAIATVYLAYKQYRIERFMAKQALYAKRLESFTAAVAYSSELAFHGNLSPETNRRFREAVSESPFLFGNDAVQLMQEILRHGTEIYACEAAISTQSPDSTSSYTHTIRDHQQWLALANNRLISVFSPYLSLVRDGTLR